MLELAMGIAVGIARETASVFAGKNEPTTGLPALIGELCHDGHLLTGVGIPYDIGEAAGDTAGGTTPKASNGPGPR